MRFEQPDLELKPVGIGVALMLSGALVSVLAVGVRDSTLLFVASAVVGGLACGWVVTQAESGPGLKLGAFHGFHSVGFGGIVLIGTLLVGSSSAVAASDSYVFVVVSPLGIVLFPVIGLLAGGTGSLLRFAYASLQ